MTRYNVYGLKRVIVNQILGVDSTNNIREFYNPKVETVDEYVSKFEYDDYLRCFCIPFSMLSLLRQGYKYDKLKSVIIDTINREIKDPLAIVKLTAPNLTANLFFKNLRNEVARQGGAMFKIDTSTAKVEKSFITSFESDRTFSTGDKLLVPQDEGSPLIAECTYFYNLENGEHELHVDSITGEEELNKNLEDDLKKINERYDIYRGYVRTLYNSL